MMGLCYQTTHSIYKSEMNLRVLRCQQRNLNRFDSHPKTMSEHKTNKKMQKIFRRQKEDEIRAERKASIGLRVQCGPELDMSVVVGAESPCFCC